MLASSPALHFDAATHRYTVAGLVVPSVTQIIGLLNDYAGIPRDVLDAAAWLGNAVHEACALDDINDLAEESVDADVLPYLSAWRRFRRETGYAPEHTEARVHSLRHGFAGTLDSAGRLRRNWAVIDIKTTAKLPASAGPQTAGYDIAARESLGNWPRVLDRYTVQLRDDGTYRMQQHHNHPRDASIFLAALALHSWKANYAN